MKEIKEVPMPEQFDICPSKSHWENMIIDGECHVCNMILQSRHGVQIDERPQQPITEPEVGGMYARSESRSQAYRDAHS